MKIVAVNAGPRKNWNTAKLLQAALEGASACGAETKLLHLYDYQFTGCKSCFACKRLGSPFYGRCAAQDDLTAIIAELHEADGFILGSPIYFGSTTGEFRSLLERLCFAVYAYDRVQPDLWGKKSATGIVYTMGVPNADLYKAEAERNAALFERVFGAKSEIFTYTNAYQFDDYSKYHCPIFNVEAKKAHYAEFDQDLDRAKELGATIARRATALQK